MLKAIIKSIEQQYLLPDDDYRFILDHLNEPLKVSSINVSMDNKLYVLTVCTGNEETYETIVLFVDNTYGLGNGVKYEFVGELPMSN